MDAGSLDSGLVVVAGLVSDLVAIRAWEPDLPVVREADPVFWV